MNSKVKYFIKKLKTPFVLLSFILAVVGSYQVYHGKYPSIIKEIIVITYSVFKLFTFFPTRSILESSPLAYELAVWMAPTTTVLGFLSIFRYIYNDVVLSFKHLSKNRLIIVGYNNESITFIKDTKEKYPKIKMICLVDEMQEADTEILRKYSVKLFRIDYKNPESDANKLLVKEEKLYKGGKIISFENEPTSYSHIQILGNLLKNYPKVDVYLRTESFRLKELIEERLDRIKNFDIHYFNLNDLMVFDFLINSNFSVNYTNGIKQSWREKKFHSLEEISKQVSRANILIVGYSSIVDHLLNNLSNLSVINPLRSIKVTMIDENAKDKFDSYKDYKTMIDNVMEYELINLKSKSRDLKEIYFEKSKKENFTAIFFCDDKDYVNIINIDRIEKYIRNLPVAIYNSDNSEVDMIFSTIKEKISDLHIFGNLKKVINYDVIVNEKMLEKAKYFNSFYNKITNNLLEYYTEEKSIDEQWKNLSNVKKESSWFQSMHQDTKRLILSKFSELEEFKDKDILNFWKIKLEGKTIEEQVDIIESDIYMNYMTSLEHKRWNNFYYMRDFVFDDVKDESNKTHDCLIDDWNVFLNSKQRLKATYDFISTLSLDK